MLKHIDGKTVTRTLTHIHRSMILGAGQFYVSPGFMPDGRTRMSEPHSEWKDAAKFEKIRKLLDFDELSDFEDAREQDLREKTVTWLKRGTDNPQSLEPRPSMTIEDRVGVEQVYELPRKVDDLIVEYLKNMKWDTGTSRYSTALGIMFGLKLDAEWDFSDLEEVANGDGGNDKKAATVPA